MLKQHSIIIAELDKHWLLARWFLILLNSCLVVTPIHDVFLSQEHVYWQKTFEQNRAGKG